MNVGSQIKMAIFNLQTEPTFRNYKTNINCFSLFYVTKFINKSMSVINISVFSTPI